METGSAEESEAASTTPAAVSHVLPSTDQVDGIPKSKQRQRTRRACYPCSKRKIKCDRDERTPCSNCAKRPNAELCTFDDDRPRSARPRHSANTASPTPGSLANDDLKHERTPPQPLLRGIRNAGTPFTLQGDERKLVLQPGDPPRSISTLDGQPPSHKASSSIARYSVVPDHSIHGITSHPSMGNGFMPVNSGAPHLPLPGPSTLAPLSLKTPADELRSLLPPVKQVTKYCEIYHTYCHGLFPVDIGIPHIPDLSFQYMNEGLGDRLIAHLETRNIEAFRFEAIRVALLCSAITAGVQVSDLDEASRRSTLRQYAATTMKLLRMADVQASASIAGYPVLLIMSRVMQDELEPILSYTMLGSLQKMAQVYSIALSLTDRYAEETRHMRSSEGLLRVRLRQETFLALVLGQSHLLERPPFPDIRSWTNASYTQCIDVLAAVVAYCGSENIDREESLVQHADAMQMMRSLDRWAMPHLVSKTNCHSAHELSEFCALRVHDCLVNIHYCQIIMAACRRLPGHEEEYFKTGEVCRTKAQDCIDAYLHMLGFTVIPLRSWILTIAALRAALILGVLLAEFSHSVENSIPDRDRLTRLHNAFTNVHDDSHADRSRWVGRYTAIFDRLREICDAAGQPDTGSLATNGTTASPTEQGTALRYMTRDDRDNIMMPQRMVQHYLAAPAIEPPNTGSPLFSYQSIFEI